MFRMPIFTWNIFFTPILILIAFPVLTAALLGQLADPLFGAHVFDQANGGAILWQHLFWYFGHPEVYIVALPFFGIITEIIPVFSRKPLFGSNLMIFATVLLTALSVVVWAHHMFASSPGGTGIRGRRASAGRGQDRLVTALATGLALLSLLIGLAIVAPLWIAR